MKTLRNLAILVLAALAAKEASAAEKKNKGLELAVNHYLRHTDETTAFDTVSWGKKLFAGVGGNSQGAKYVGFMIERAFSDLEVTLGANVAETDDTQSMFQLALQKGPYRLGIGHVDNDTPFSYIRPELEYKLSDWDVQIAAIVGRFQDGEVKVGGSFFATNGIFRFGASYTGEEANYQIGFVAPEGNYLRPAIEIFRYDKNVGSEQGNTITLISGTLQFSKGHLNHGAGQGRVEGITGANEQNPFFGIPNANYLAPLENVGNILNVRILDVQTPDGHHNTLYQAVLFPLQAISRDSGLYLEINYQEQVGFAVGYREKNIGLKYSRIDGKDMFSLHLSFDF